MNRLNLPQNAPFRAFFVHLPRSTAVRLRHLLEKSIENPPFCGASNSERFTARIDEAKSADNTSRIDKDFNKVYTAVKLSESGSTYSHSAKLLDFVIRRKNATVTGRCELLQKPTYSSVVALLPREKSATLSV